MTIRIEEIHREACGRDLIARLPEGVDCFGENGEFHSYVEILVTV
jgi:hypothetical protein